MSDGDRQKLGDDPAAVLIATGSEVSLALEARARLEEDGVAVRVVSLPCWEAFARQDHLYRDSVLPPGSRRLAIEAGVALGWERWVGETGDVLGVERFGASAPLADLQTLFGFTKDQVLDRVKRFLADSTVQA